MENKYKKWIQYKKWLKSRPSSAFEQDDFDAGWNAAMSENANLLQACQKAVASLEAQDNIHALPIAIWDAMQEMRGAIAMAKG